MRGSGQTLLLPFSQIHGVRCTLNVSKSKLQGPLLAPRCLLGYGESPINVPTKPCVLQNFFKSGILIQAVFDCDCSLQTSLHLHTAFCQMILDHRGYLGDLVKGDLSSGFPFSLDLLGCVSVVCGHFMFG